jgi:alginate O-acetyltransferase complex protein AlgJ
MIRRIWRGKSGKTYIFSMNFSTLAQIERELVNRNLILHKDVYSRPYGEMSSDGTAVAGLGHYFISNGVNRWEDQILGRLLCDGPSLESWQQFIRMNSDRSKELDIQLCYLIVPEKQVVLPQFRWIDAEKQILDNRPINQIRSLYSDRKEFPLVYPVEAFRDQQGECELYFRGNSHWCSTGCWIAGLEVIRFFFSEQLVRKSLMSASIIAERQNVQHDLLAHFYENVPFEEAINIRSPGKIFYRRFTLEQTGHHTGSYLWLLNEQAPIQERLAVIGDSYSTFLSPVFSCFFREVHFVWTKQIPWEQLSKQHIRFIIWQCAERFLIVPPLSRALETL